MRAGGCAVQQALAAEAAGVVRQAVTLARRRGHAQVTRLPASAGASPLLGGGHHHAPPALSNALVAAFKRAQAHQRRGSVEGQPPHAQQPPSPVVASKVELEQLIISILDDPSVSRVMREAGFSSSQVKANVEKAVASLDHANAAGGGGHTGSPNSGHGGRNKESSTRARVDDDAMRVLDCMASGRKRCVVVVGEGAAAAETVVKAVMDRVSKAELHHRHECLKNLQFVPLSVASFHGAPREEVEAKAGDLRALVRSGCAAGKGVVLVLEDLAYAAEAWAAASNSRRRTAIGTAGGQSYCSVEHAVMEVSSLVSGGGGGERFWVLGFGSYQVYMKCRAGGQPPLEAVWELHPVVVPDGGLALSLTCSEASQASQVQARPTTGWPFVNGAGEAATTASPTIPPWLRRYQDPDHATPANCGTGLQLQDVWNPMRNGSAPYHTSELTLSFSSPSPSSISGCYTNMMNSKPWQLEASQPWPIHGHGGQRMAMASYHDHQPLDINPSPDSNSVSNSSDGGEPKRPKFTELNAENLKILCNALESRVPRHSNIVPDIASTVLQCRSGMKKMKLRHKEIIKASSTTWLLFQGRDSDGKKVIARELAKLVFGSYTEFTSISVVDELASAYSDSSSGELTLKRQRSADDIEHSFTQRLSELVCKNPHQVIVIDDIEQLDHDSEISIKKAIANGRMRWCNGEEVDFEDAIIVLSCEEEFDSRSRASSSPRVKQRLMNNNDDEERSSTEKGDNSPRCFSLDLNACLEDEEEDESFLLDNGVGMHNIVDGVFFFGLMADL
uniref:Clp R domain-containing protein n=1 Tax=Oryza punctata TaxID=4537 RepID=A0A0E0MCN3_ORYPU